MDVCWRELAATPPVATMPSPPPQQEQSHHHHSSAASTGGAAAGIMGGIGKCFLLYLMLVLSKILVSVFFYNLSALSRRLLHNCSYVSTKYTISSGAPPSAHASLLGARAPFSPPPQALLSSSNNNPGGTVRVNGSGSGSGMMPAVEAQLFGAQGKNLTHMLPVVNEREGIHQHFLIRLSGNN